jgi:hypothetical protein
LPAEVHLIIQVVSASGKPTHPKVNATKFVNECGVLVRDHIPISTQEWHEPKKVKGASFVTNTKKDDLWTRLSSKFTLPTLATTGEMEALKLKVKKWALKKMAQQFNNRKKKLYNNYIKNKKPPEFTGSLGKQWDHWETFLEYKESTVALERSRKNKANAAKKIYHHTMGSAGYKTSVPGWDKKDADLIS